MRIHRPRPFWAGFNQGAEGVTDTRVELKKGDLVENFRIMAELGRGAASIIYLAQDTKTKQIRALKHVIKTNPKDQRFLDQAEAEAKVSRDLNHPGIRTIDRVIRRGSFLSTKEMFLVMELVDGVSMEAQPPKTFEQAVAIFEQAARALAHMHGRGWVHADMKPNNIIVDAYGRAKVIDLGQACKVGTVKERIQGTPDYIAPEQVHRREITPKTDIYNLGAAMYWVLTRHHIPTALAKDTESLMGSIDDALLEKPKPAIELNPKIGKHLNDLIMQCVEVRTEDRPESMELVADKLNLVHGILLANAGRGKEAVRQPNAESA